jgi:hypothetical protein
VHLGLRIFHVRLCGRHGRHGFFPRANIDEAGRHGLHERYHRLIRSDLIADMTRNPFFSEWMRNSEDLSRNWGGHCIDVSDVGFAIVIDGDLHGPPRDDRNVERNRLWPGKPDKAGQGCPYSNYPSCPIYPNASHGSVPRLENCYKIEPIDAPTNDQRREYCRDQHACAG